MKNENKKAFIFIILILTTAIITIFLALFRNFYVFTKNKQMLLKIPTIKTTIYSSSSDKNYFINISLCLDIVPSCRKNIDINNVKINIEKLVSSLDVEKISSLENTKYIKDSIIEDIYNYVPKNSIKKVYISDIILSQNDKTKKNKRVFPKFSK